MATTVAEKIIRIDVVASANAQRAINAISSDLKRVESATSSMQAKLSTGFGGVQQIFSKLAGFLGAFGIAAGVGAMTKAVVDAATSWTVLEARMKLVLGTQERADEATAKIADIARLTGRELDGVAKLYEKAARSAAQFGIAEDKVREITLGFSQSIRLSGASTQEAYASLVQFGQALASGRLQGDEFRSLMENNAVFMYEFAKSAGISVSALRRMGTEGKLNAKFLFETMSKEGEGGLNMMQRLNKMAAEVPLTIGQSFNSLKASLTEFVGEAASLLSPKTGNADLDKYGFFGPLVRGVQALTVGTKELKVEMDSLDLSKYERAGRTLEGFLKYLRDKAIGSGIPGLEAAAGLSKLLEGPDKSLTGRMEENYKNANTVLEKANQDLARLLKERDKLLGEGKELPQTLNARLLLRRSKVAEAESVARSLKADLDKLYYGERVDPNYGSKPPKPEPTSEELRLAASKQKVLNDQLDTLREKVDIEKRLLSGESEQKAVLKDLVAFETALAEAGVKYNSARAIQGYQLLSEIEILRDRNEVLKETKKLEEKNLESLVKQTDKVSDSITRDEAAIDALQNKTRASQEYTTALLEQERAQVALQVNDQGLFAPEGDQQMAALEELLRLYDNALGKRKELQETQAVKKQADSQEKVDAVNARRVQNLAEEINTALTRGLANGNAGEALVKNLQDTLKKTTVDVIVNPVTNLFASKLAAIADQFSTYLSQELAAALANGVGASGGDALGSFIDLLDLGDSFRLGTTQSRRFATGLNYVPYDEFPALLHTGERVMTAKENAAYSQGMGGGVMVSSNPTIVIDSRTDAATVYGIVSEAVNAGNAALVEEMRAQGVLR